MDNIRRILGFDAPPSGPGAAASQNTSAGGSPLVAPGGNNNNNNNNNKDGKAAGDEEKFSGFDPRGLERAAKAAKELEASPMGKDAVALAKEQERTAQVKAQQQVEELKARSAAFAAERARIEGEERRRAIEAEHQAQQHTAQYQDQLARKRNQDQLQAQAAMRAQELKRQEESALRIESLKRETAQYEANLRKETDLAKSLADAEGRIKQERANFDLALERSRLEASEFRKTVLEGVRETGAILGAGFRDYITDREKMGNTIIGLSLLALGVYGARTGTGVVGRFVEARLGKPPLVRETSRRGLLGVLRHPLRAARERFLSSTSAAGALHSLEGVVIEPKLKSRLEHLAVATANAKRHGAPFRHMLLHGPPGTGKTLFAKKLAKASGMDYAIMTGGDVAPLGREAVTEIHRLFDWSRTSRRGVLIFVDEADAFLRKRTNETMSEDLRDALNAFLYRTGSETRDFLLVFATNVPSQLDFAVVDRTDETVEFALPRKPERLAMLRLYVTKYVEGKDPDAPRRGLLSRRATPIRIAEDVNEELWESVAERVKGFSGREMAKLGVAFQSAAYAAPEPVLTRAIVEEVVDAKVQSHIDRLAWVGSGELRMEKE